jgi:transposase
MVLSLLADIEYKWTSVRRSQMKKYVVELTSQERKELEGLVKKGKVAGYKIRHAQMLLKADQSKQGPGWHDKQIAEAFGAHLTTVERLRKRFVEEGFAAALERHKRQNYTRKLDGDAEARLIAIACSEPPDGRNQWTLRLLADRLVELSVVDSISHMTVKRTLEKKRTQALAK